MIRARSDRVGRDRLEILTALINAPSFDPIFRPDVIVIPRDHPVYRWTCVVDCCERSRSGSSELCAEHLRQLAAVEKPSGEPSIVTTVTRMTVFNTLRQMLRDAMDTGAAEKIGLGREFIVTVPTGGETKHRNARRPYSDEVARALADGTT